MKMMAVTGDSIGLVGVTACAGAAGTSLHSLEI